MAHIGHPLVGDFLYGKASPEGYKLRCVELAFPHPITRELIRIKA
jgi:23S rRNA-/tRNA-specific pseudouridylate synthase